MDADPHRYSPFLLLFDFGIWFVWQRLLFSRKLLMVQGWWAPSFLPAAECSGREFRGRRSRPADGRPRGAIPAVGEESLAYWRGGALENSHSEWPARVPLTGWPPS